MSRAVLLVAPSPESNRSLATALRAMGQTVHCAAELGGLMALALAKPFETIIFDMGLGEIVPRDLLEELRSRLPETPVLFLHSGRNEHLETLSADFPLVRVLRHPFTVDELRSALENKDLAA